MLNFNHSRTKDKKALIATISIVLASILIVFAIVYSISFSDNSIKSPVEDIHLPLSTLDVHQWLQDHPSDIVGGYDTIVNENIGEDGNEFPEWQDTEEPAEKTITNKDTGIVHIPGIDVGTSNKYAIAHESNNTTEIFHNTSFADLQSAVPDVNNVTMYFYLNLNNQPDGVYTYGFKLYFNNIDSTRQSEILITLIVNKEGNKIPEAYLNDGSHQPAVKIDSINSMLAVQYDTLFRKEEPTSSKFSIKDMTADELPTSISSLHPRQLVNENTDTLDYTTNKIRSLNFISTSPALDLPESSTIDKNDPSIYVRSLQLTAAPSRGVVL